MQTKYDNVDGFFKVAAILNFVQNFWPLRDLNISFFIFRWFLN